MIYRVFKCDLCDKKEEVKSQQDNDIPYLWYRVERGIGFFNSQKVMHICSPKCLKKLAKLEEEDERQ
jgi:hypothetical protein